MAKVLARLSRPYHEIIANRRGGTARHGLDKNKWPYPRTVSPNDGTEEGETNWARQAGDEVLVNGKGDGPPVPPVRQVAGKWMR
ncbi:MAG: hypothetical protein IT327_23010 [Anaerolineae bacterium]|nr:hypothetical protein [Anaerolineae bacterium]